MPFSSSVLKNKARHRRWLRKTKGLRAHQAERARAIEANKELDLTARFPTAAMFAAHMREKLGCY